MSASETHNKKNVNKTIAETLAAFEETVPPAIAAGAARARLRLDGLRLPLRGRRRPGARRWSSSRELARSAATRSRWATPSAWPTRARCATCCRACWPRSRRTRWRCTSTTRAAPRWPTSWSRSRWASPPSTPRWAGWAAAPTRPAPPATSRPRTSSTCCEGMGVAHRHRSRRAGRLRAAGLDARRARDAVQVLPGRRRRALARQRRVDDESLSPQPTCDAMPSCTTCPTIRSVRSSAAISSRRRALRCSTRTRRRYSAACSSTRTAAVSAVPVAGSSWTSPSCTFGMTFWCRIWPAGGGNGSQTFPARHRRDRGDSRTGCVGCCAVHSRPRSGPQAAALRAGTGASRLVH